MSCELVEDDDSISTVSCYQDFDTDSETETLQPHIVNVASLSSNNCNNEPIFSPVFLTDDAAEQSLPELPLKRLTSRTNCYVVLERLPQRLVQAAQTCEIIVSENTVSSGTGEFRLDDQTVKLEPDNFSDEQKLFLSLNSEPHLENVNSSACSTVVTNCATMTDAVRTATKATNTMLHENVAGKSLHRTDRNISVILLNSVQPPKMFASHETTHQDISSMVIDMLQRQNISLTPVNNSRSLLIRNENDDQGNMRGIRFK